MSSDFVISLLRTGVPAAWGLLIAWATSQFGWLSGLFEATGWDPTSKQTGAMVTTVFFFLWYTAWRWVQNKNFSWMPPFVIALAMGSTAEPEYYSARHTIDVMEDRAEAPEDLDVVDDPEDHVTPSGEWGDPVDTRDERGAFDNSLLLAVAAVVVIVAGLIYIATAL